MSLGTLSFPTTEMADQETLWKETLWYNCMRAFFAGVVWCTIIGLGQGDVFMLIGGPFVFAFIMYPIFGITTAIICGLLGPLGLLVAILPAIFVVSIGDPFVFALSKVKPEWVPVEKPAFFSLKLLIRVMVPKKTKRYAVIELPD